MTKGSKGITYFSQLVTVAIGVSGKKSFKITLPSEYNTITGVAVANIVISNQANYKVSLANAKETFMQDLIHKLLRFDDGVPPAYKMLPTMFPYKDNNEHTLVVECVDGAVAAADLTFDLILRLELLDDTCFANRQKRDFPEGSNRPEELVDYGTNS